MCFLKLAMPLPTGGVHIMELDEPAAREALAEMETWGDDCSQDSKEMRDALRAKFNEENAPAMARPDQSQETTTP